MLEALKKAMTKQSTAENVVDMASFDEVKSELSALTEKYSLQSEELSSVISELSNVKSLYAAAVEQAEKLEAAVKEQAQKAFESEMEARKKLLEETVGSATCMETFEATKALDATAFNAVVSALKLSVVKESASPLFTEQGMTGKADETKDPVQVLAQSLASKFSK